MKAKMFTKDMVFIDVIDISQISFKRQRNKEYTISCKPIADSDYNWEQVHFIYFLDDNEEKTKRIQYKPCGVLEGYNGDTLSIKSMESYLEKVSQVPENFTWWNNKRLENVVGDLCYGFRRIKKSTLTQMQDVVASNHVQFGTLEDGNGEVYADTGYYFSPSNIYELYYYSDGYVIYRITLPEEARRQGLVLRWSDQTGTTTDISVQFRWSNVSSDFSGVYSTEQSPLRGDNVRPNETSGVDIPESDNTYLFVKFNLKYDTGSTDTFVKGYNYEQEITTVEGEGGNKYVYYGKTGILRAFEVIYRVNTRIQAGDISVSETQLMQADLSNCDNLLSVLKAVCDAYGLTFFISFDNNVLSLNVYNEYINDTTNQTIITDKINSVTKRKDIKIDELQAVEAFGIGSGFDRIHTFVKAKDSETNIRNIGKYEGEETNEADLIVSAKAYIEKENEEISSASFEYYNMPLQVNDKVRVVIDKNVYTSLITEESYNFNGSKTEKEYTIGIRKYAFDGMFQSPFSGIYLYKPEKPSNLVATRKEEGWSVTWQGKTQKYLLQYKRSITSPWNTIFVNGTNVYIPYTEYDREYTFSVYAVDDRGVYSDAVYVFSNSLSEIIYLWETYNDSDSQPNTPTGEGNANGWHRNLTQEAKWMSKKESHRITEGIWSVPVLMPSAVKDGISTDIPDNVTGLTAVAMRDGIQIRCNSLSGGTKNIVNKYNFELLLEGSSTWISISSDTNSAFYTFDRSTIGYPEASAIDGSQVRCKVTNVYGYASLSYATAAVSVVGYGTWIPVKPSSLVIVAEEKSLTLRFNQVDGSNYYGSTIYTVKLSYSGTTRVEKSGLREKFYIYDFNRSIDGYPEKTVITGKPYLGNYSLLITATDIVSGKTNVSNTDATIDSSNYGTWIPTAPTVFNMQSGNRSIVVGWQIPLSSGIYIYGLRFYEIQISKDGTNWYKPETTKTGKVLETDWYNGTGQVRISGVQFAQALPLTGQTLGLPVNTTYYYRVRTIGVTDSYVSAWSTAQTGTALATGIGDIIEKSVKEAQLGDASVSNIKVQDGSIVASEKVVANSITTELLNVLAKNKINNFSITGTLEGWTTTGTLVDDASGFKKLRFTYNGFHAFQSNVFTVQPNEICSFEFGISCPNYTSLSGAYIGLTVDQSFKQYVWNFTLNKWIAGSVQTYAYFILDYKETAVKYYKSYILGSKVDIADIPAPAATDTTYGIFALQLQGTDTTARLRAGFNPITAGTYWEIYNPQIYSNQGGKIVAQQIITPSLSAIVANIGEITSGILRSVIKAGESKPNVSLDLDTEEFRVGNNPSLEDSNDPNAEYLHWIPNDGLFLKLKNLIVDAIASTIRGRFRVRGTMAEMAQSVLIVNPESTKDPDTNTPANTTVIKTALQCPAGITGNLTGNASTATKLATARKINNVLFDGTADIITQESPPTPWAQYSGKDIPQLPDNLAGTTYKRDNDWVDTDGWIGWGSLNTLSIENNMLKVVSTVSGAGIEGTIGLYANKTVVIAIESQDDIGDVKFFNGAVYVTVPFYKITNKKVIAYFYSATTHTTFLFRVYNTANTPNTIYVSSIYIGTGAYDRIVFDNSYHYRHLLNNAVVPTPQGLYFNGATSYLRSKEKITLPDVFTFSATVNCSIKSTIQVFILHGNPGTANNRVYVCRDTSSNTLFINCSDTSLTEVTFFTGVNYFLGLDNTDIDVKVEINFINQTIKVYRDGIQFGTTVSAPSMVKPVANNLYIGNSNTLGSPFLGYMRNICIYDTSLTDTQRNWLAQGNTPPILYDVTNYETEGYVSIQDADGTNTGVETDVDSNGNRILKIPATIKANLTGNADTSDKWKTARNISISDADGTNTGAVVEVDGSENETLKLPSTIKANVNGNLTGNVTGNTSGSSSNVNSTNFFLNEDATYVNLHTKNSKPLYLNSGNVAGYFYGNPVLVGNAGQKVGILTSSGGLYDPSSTYPIAIGGNVHCNNKSIHYASELHCQDSGRGDLRLTTAKGSLPGYPNDYYSTIKTNYYTLYFSLDNAYVFAIYTSSGTTTLYTGTNTKLTSGSPFYGAVGNDICDNIKIASPVKDWEYGYCYCEENGEYKRGNKGIIGITSDTASLHCGSDDGMEAGKDYLPIAIGGFVLAFVDRKYRRGTPLKAKKDGSLTRATIFTPCWKILATYQEEPKEETWNKAKVNGRVIVRVK